MSDSQRSVLVVDDDVVFARALIRRLHAAGWATRHVTDGADALKLLEVENFDAMVLDLQMRNVGGFGVLEVLPRMPRRPVTILLSGHLSVATTVQAMRAGVADVLEKPVDGAVLDARLRAAVAARRSASASTPPGDAAEQLLGTTPAIRAVREQLRLAAQRPSTSVLVVGEVGVGKGLVVRVLHQLTSPDAPFVPVDCGALPAETLQLKLRGEDGAQGLLEAAGTGTVFLEEIARLPTEVQPTLRSIVERRRFVPEGASDARVLHARITSTTSVRLTDTRRVHLDPDLILALSTITISMPPLRERLEDLPEIAQHTLNIVAEQRQEGPRTLLAAALELLSSYDWPGNIRELRSVLEQALMIGGDDEVGAHEVSLALAQRRAQQQLKSQLPPDVPSSGDEAQSGIRDFERGMILRAFEACHGNLSLTARRLGLPRTTLRDKLKRYGVR